MSLSLFRVGARNSPRLLQPPGIGRRECGWCLGSAERLQAGQPDAVAQSARSIFTPGRLPAYRPRRRLQLRWRGAFRLPHWRQRRRCQPGAGHKFVRDNPAQPGHGQRLQRRRRICFRRNLPFTFFHPGFVHGSKHEHLRAEHGHPFAPEGIRRSGDFDRRAAFPFRRQIGREQLFHRPPLKNMPPPLQLAGKQVGGSGFPAVVRVVLVGFAFHSANRAS